MSDRSQGDVTAKSTKSAGRINVIPLITLSLIYFGLEKKGFSIVNCNLSYTAKIIRLCINISDLDESVGPSFVSVLRSWYQQWLALCWNSKCTVLVIQFSCTQKAFQCHISFSIEFFNNSVPLIDVKTIWGLISCSYNFILFIMCGHK